MLQTRSKQLQGAVVISMLAACVAMSLPALAVTTQNLSATIDGKKFESDDAGILYLMPTKNGFNLIAGTKGASAYPPPKTPTDRLSFNCRNFEGRPRKYTARDFGSSGCEVTFVRGESKVPFGAPDAEYRHTGGNNAFEITAVNGKVIEGKFSLEMVEIKTRAKIKITDGVFKAEDRQK